MPRWTPEVVEWLKNNCSMKTKYQLSEEIEACFGIHYTPAAVSSYMGEHGIKTGLQPWKKRETKQKLPLNTERLKDGYIYIKTAQPNKWRVKHYVVLEENGQKVKPDEQVVFLDGNRQNVTLENLFIVKKRVMWILNSHYPDRPKGNPELTKTYIILSQIMAAEKDRAMKHSGVSNNGTVYLVQNIRNDMKKKNQSKGERTNEPEERTDHQS